MISWSNSSFLVNVDPLIPNLEVILNFAGQVDLKLIRNAIYRTFQRFGPQCHIHPQMLYMGKNPVWDSYWWYPDGIFKNLFCDYFFENLPKMTPKFIFKTIFYRKGFLTHKIFWGCIWLMVWKWSARIQNSGSVGQNLLQI